MKSISDRIKEAQTAGIEELWKIIKDPHPEVISNATLNRNLTEDMAVYIAKSKTTPSETLGFLAGDIRFKDSYKLKVVICKNPRTPQKVSLSLLKFLRIFDLADLTKDQHLPVNLRQKIEFNISERVPSMPSGVKIALAKRGNSSIVMTLLEKSDEQVISVCLESPAITEGNIYKIINKTSTKPHIISMIAEHPKWSARYAIRFGLIRNFYTPMTYVTQFIKGIKTFDLRELYADTKVPSSTKPFIYNELLERDESVEHQKEVIYEVSEDEDTNLSDTSTDL